MFSFSPKMQKYILLPDFHYQLYQHCISKTNILQRVDKLHACFYNKLMK